MSSKITFASAFLEFNIIYIIRSLKGRNNHLKTRTFRPSSSTEILSFPKLHHCQAAYPKSLNLVPGAAASKSIKAFGSLSINTVLQGVDRHIGRRQSMCEKNQGISAHLK